MDPEASCDEIVSGGSSGYGGGGIGPCDDSIGPVRFALDDHQQTTFAKQLHLLATRLEALESVLVNAPKLVPVKVPQNDSLMDRVKLLEGSMEQHGTFLDRVELHEVSSGRHGLLQDRVELLEASMEQLINLLDRVKLLEVSGERHGLLQDRTS